MRFSTRIIITPAQVCDARPPSRRRGPLRPSGRFGVISICSVSSPSRSLPACPEAEAEAAGRPGRFLNYLFPFLFFEF